MRSLMTPLSSQNENAERSNYSERDVSTALQRLLKLVSSYKSHQLLKGLAHEVCDILGVYASFITLREDFPITRFKVLGRNVNGDQATEGLFYDLDMTPCQEVVKCAQPVLFVDDILEKFPEDHFFSDHGIVSYWGIPYFDLNEKLLGHLFVMDTKPILPNEHVKSILDIFASICGAEVEKEVQRQALEEAKNEAELANARLQDINQQMAVLIEKRTADIVTVSKELDTLLYRASHDFKSPFTTLEGLINLEEQTYPERKDSEYFQMIKETINKLRRLNESVVRVGTVRYMTPACEVLNLHDTMQQLVNNLKYQIATNVETRIVIGGENGDIETNTYLLKLLLNCLLENAMAYGHKNRKNCITVQTTFQHGVVDINIADQGQGIKPEYLPRITEMFFKGTDQSTGFGLGLYLARNICEKIHANLSFDSVLGKGTSVSINLPERLSVKLAQSAINDLYQGGILSEMS
jgi:signal transduction histidine kinase